ncbi:GNAT family N-acetyltransferase [Marinomonas piezotolerans]|uniref:GNAT family N-acetyltransferase n=1 Tax=Marinomonas piezotolerans TaxID=2213058 RepID=A0A370UB40_9GAMM|nr:GNAT family N-acetyltransferase [Marinomonas piezotolerans]RDL45013.1 GNAT family N-acetyltransferase [Marinomonas piezotolerans]
MDVRDVKREEIPVWAEMRTVLWPQYDEDHTPELEKYFAGTSNDVVQTFVAEVEGSIAGFIEINIRNFAEGSVESAVPFVEAWFVKPEFRGRGVGSALMKSAEAWAVAQGYSELASDADETNLDSIDLHYRLNFKETARVVCFLKKLNT